MKTIIKTHKIFPKIDGILHGGDYNPDQWLDRPDILKEDIRLMKKAGINCVTLGVFSWSSYERREDEFDFSWLKKVMDDLYENGIYTILATPSGSKPAWLDKKYPDAIRVDENGIKAHHGMRENHCMSSPNVERRIRVIDRKLAENFADHPGLLMWHISNEYTGYCYCDNCKQEFRRYLSKRFDGDIEKLNHAWWTTFWSHTYNDFDEIDPPFMNGERSILGQNLEWRRFNTWNVCRSMKMEIDTLREVRADIPVTTNFMCLFEDFDYRVLAKELDCTSWDAYPFLHNDYESLSDTLYDNAFNHVLYACMKKDRPFMLMESAPGLVNWSPYNKYKRPGIHALMSFQALSCGSDTVQYFQIRKGRGCSEQFHGALIDHLGTDDTRIFKEVEDLGQKLLRVKNIQGSVRKSEVAVIFEWDVRWAVKDSWALSNETKNYDRTVMDAWKELAKMGCDPDIISSDDDFSEYKMIVAPMLYLLHDGVGEKIKEYVEGGGQFIATYFTGYVDKDTLCYLGGFPGQGLSEVFGIISEEIDTLYPKDSNEITFVKDGRKALVKDYQELLRVKDAKVLATYEQDYLKGTAAVTAKEHGKGSAWYVGCRLSPEDMHHIFDMTLDVAGIKGISIPEGVEYHARYTDGKRYEFYLNTNETPVTIENVSGRELLYDKDCSGRITLERYAVAVVDVSV